MRKTLLTVFILLVVTTLAFSHGGGLDANGGHMDRKTGTYHYHRAPTPAPAATYSTTTTTTIRTTYAPAATTVYVTKTGEKYHTQWCYYLAQSKIEIQLGAAVARAFEPCRVCRPPLLLIEEALQTK